MALMFRRAAEGVKRDASGGGADERFVPGGERFVIGQPLGLDWVGGMPPGEIRVMEIDTDKIDDAVLGLMWLTLHDKKRAWKGFDWDALGRLHDKGLFGDPIGKTKSVVLSDEGLKRAEALFQSLFTRPK
jgi:hypothetical protein